MATTETMNPVALRLERKFDASPERVFKAWINPQAVATWFGPTPEHKAEVTAMDARVGGNYRIQIVHTGGNVHTAFGTYREVTPPTKIVMTWAWEGNTALGESLVTVEFTPSGAGTQMVLTHELLPTDEAREAHKKGWTGCFEKLGAVLAS